jgi:UDP-glucuronate decarboxylase
VEEIARLILAQTGSRSTLRHLPLPQDDPKRRKPVIDRVATALGWSPHVDLEDGLRATIGYFSLKLFSTAERDHVRKSPASKPPLRDVARAAAH